MKLTQKQIKEKQIAGGKKGSDIRWASRHEIILELAKIYGKDGQDEFFKMSTEKLKTILSWHQKNE